jgi:hypothetical protein
MGISGAQSSGQRLQGLVPTTDISVCRIGDLASPTEHRMPRQNDDGRHPGRSAGTSGMIVDGTFHRVDLRNVPKSPPESGILFETTKGSAWQRK